MPLNNFNGDNMPSDTTNTVVIAIQGNPISATTPTTDQALMWDGSEWVPTNLPSTLPPSGSAGGDLGGTYPNPDVINIHGASVPVAGALIPGNVLQVSGGSALSYGPINLAGGSDYVSGVLPIANQAAQTLGGDLSGTTVAATVIKLQGRAVANTAPTDGYVLTYVSASSDWEPKPIPAGMTGLRKDYFTSSGNWTCPAGVTNVLIIASGGGGGGNGGQSTTLGGGAGGGAIQVTSSVPVTPGNVYAVTIGSGGTAGTANTNNAGDGGTTSFGSLFFATGAAKAGTTNNTVGGGPVVGCIAANSVFASGGANGIDGRKNVIGGFAGGTTGSNSGTAIGGGGGGAGSQGPGGNGGNGVTGTGQAGFSAGANTGAGGGGGGAGTVARSNGGTGGSGYLYVVY